MAVLCPYCAGLEISEQSVVACRLGLDANGQKIKAVETFGTTTAELLRLSDWLTAGACTHVAMASTGYVWQPIWNLLAGGFELLLVNVQHIECLAGRRIDVEDSEWLAALLQDWLLKASFVKLISTRCLNRAN